jgi:hypothetical protein
MDMTREEIERLTEEITNISAFDAVHYPYYCGPELIYGGPSA